MGWAGFWMVTGAACQRGAGAAAIAAALLFALPAFAAPQLGLSAGGKEKDLKTVLQELVESKGDMVKALEPAANAYLSVETEEEARLVCELLKLLPRKQEGSPLRTELDSLIGLLDVDVESAAFDLLASEGAPQLCRIVDALASSANESDREDMFAALRLLASLRRQEGLERILRIARTRWKPDQTPWQWHWVFSKFDEDHPLREELYEAFCESPPEGSARLALLEWFNDEAVRKTDFGKKRHPFDSDQGVAILRELLASWSPDDPGAAKEAAIAIAFLQHPERKALVGLALAHREVEVQLEGAWAGAMHGEMEGIAALRKYCLDFRYSKTASAYLEEAKQADAIPPESQAPEFAAKAEFADWLAHPNELAQPPDQVEVIDRRLLEWPPERRPNHFWLLQYRLKDRYGLEPDDVNVGVVGSMTFCHFSRDLLQRPPEDVYAIHCIWEMQNQELVQEFAVLPNTSRSDPRLREWEGEPLEEVQCLKMIALDPKLKYPAKNLLVYSAVRKGEKGWFYLDGPRSRWYGESEMPAETSETTVTQIHVGRGLLGFEKQPDRKAALQRATAPPELTPAQFTAAYEKVLAKIESTDEFERRSLLEGYESPLGHHYERYLDAASQSKGANRADLAITVFEKAFSAAIAVKAEEREGAADDFEGPYFRMLPIYAEALKTAGKTERIDPVIERLAAHWTEDFQIARLAESARVCDRPLVAEPLLVKLKEMPPGGYDPSLMVFLAEIWFNSGRKEEARALLMDCLVRDHQQWDEATLELEKMDRAQAYNEHLALLRRLFPDEAAELLKAHSLPDQPMPVAPATP